ncbi:methyl-CpG-binding domain-containing protein 2-like [Solanum tuberosum]|uniref:methyl-CpG-binding domain-containing protein 2-like n=1 Tax=Solanum tuberosum TaxID=4113 RepID=UPI00073A2460|nr:PREDICTED: methyl-CpG-binding domain-containing protein 2-like [Solanum tuberosum]
MDQNVSHGVEPVNNMKPPTTPMALVVECARCFKWRYIPTKEKYEEIREHILERPFYCETTREWHSNKQCDDPPDLTEDESGLKWAIDTPNIPQPPPGWERVIKFRTKRNTRIADVYYNSPSYQQLRSKIEVEKYLEQHPEYATQSAKLDQFSFQIPRLLEEDYVVNGDGPPPAPMTATSKEKGKVVVDEQWPELSKQRGTGSGKP